MTTTTEEKKEHWTSEEYQNSASFVPKLATKVIGWLDAQPDDRILDIGCGDGVINVDIARILARGSGHIHGIDSSESMIASARKAVESDASISKNCTFEVLDATDLLSHHSQTGTTYDKIFSNAAMHWILRDPTSHLPFFRGVHASLIPGGQFFFEMGGQGCVAEMRSTMLSVVSRRVGLSAALAADPFFFPDEAWMRDMLEVQVGGFQVEKLELEYRPTRVVDEGGVEVWLRLMGKKIFELLGEGEERREAEREAARILEQVCAAPGGGTWIGYVRLRGVIRRI